MTIKAGGRYCIDVPGGETIIEALSANGDDVHFRTVSRTLQAKIVRFSETITVFMNGNAFSWALPDLLANSAGSGARDDRLVAPMPGLIKKVTAGRGDQVTMDAPLLVMEAMKMEHTLKAPRNGEVGEVFVAVGDQVEEGKVLLELVASSDEAA